VSKPLTALGLMSGTSLDGIDVALLVTDGETVTSRGSAMTVSYDDTQRSLLKHGLADAVGMTDRTARPGILAQIERHSTQWHAEAVQKFCKRFDVSLDRVDVIGFHGQTVVHRPDIGLTVQLGDGEELSRLCGVPVVYDMRANDMRHGGQGAPLVPVYHRALAVGLAETPVAIVNIGGVANVTWIGADDALVAFDTGPGNALLDDWMRRHTGINRDEGGRMGLVGTVDEAAVAQFLGDSFFERSLPKSLDRDSFSGISLDGLSVADGAATLVAVTTRSIAASVSLMDAPPKSWIICGGGRHNKAIMRGLENQLRNVHAAEYLGLDGDAVEAEAWAFLAVRSLRGLPLTYPGTTGVRESVTGGVLVRPA
jgi:anhydro-N-acetylmuramic acid kinase